LSKVVLRDGKALGVGLIARLGWSSRLAGMSIVPEARGQKIGTLLMGELINDAKSRGDKRMELEVIQQNLPAYNLYQKFGFQMIRKLFGFTLESPNGKPEDISEIDFRRLANRINLHGLPSLPWQLSGEALSPKGPPARAYQLQNAYIAISDPDADRIVLHSVLTKEESRRKGQATQLLSALFAKFPHRSWVVPAIFPEETRVFFEKLGFKIQELSQFQMELVFD
jgi:GNAT superfamily N-acetyltransferase